MLLEVVTVAMFVHQHARRPALSELCPWHAPRGIHVFEQGRHDYIALVQ